MPPRRVPLVRPARFSGGGGATGAFDTGSGAPAVPVPTSARARMLMLQYADDERGRFTERIFEFPQFADLTTGGFSTPSANDTQQIEVTGNRTSFLRLVALRAVLQNSNQTPLSGLETAQLLLRLQVNGEEDFTTGGNVSAPSSFAMLFSDVAAPWFWFACPPRLRVGDTVQATVTSIAAGGEGAPILTPEVAVRLVDDEWWQVLYGGRNFDGIDDSEV